MLRLKIIIKKYEQMPLITSLGSKSSNIIDFFFLLTLKILFHLDQLVHLVRVEGPELGEDKAVHILQVLPGLATLSSSSSVLGHQLRIVLGLDIKE